MNDIERRIYNIKPVYRMEFDGLIKQYAQFGGGTDSDRFSKGRSFSNVYEFYIYSFFVGLRTNTRLDIFDDDKVTSFWEVKNWKPKPIVDYLISSAIAFSDFDMLAVENMSDKSVSSEVKKIKEVIESYANGGLQYISDFLKDEPDMVDDEMLFIRLLSEEK